MAEPFESFEINLKLSDYCCVDPDWSVGFQNLKLRRRVVHCVIKVVKATVIQKRDLTRDLTSSGQAATMTTNGDMPVLCNQGASLVSRNRASTSGVQIALQPCGGDVSAFPIAASNAPQLFPSTSGYQGNVNPFRQRFHVELKEGGTNAVSWKKLVKDAQENALTFPSETAVKVNPSLVAPPTKLVTSKGVFPVSANRFSSVIEKIERLYQGVDSEEEDGYPSMDDSHYDSEDSFIDDTELDEYFRVDTATTKHTGFFVSKRKLEKVDESPPRPPLRPLPPLVHVQRERKRNVTTHSSEIVAGEFSKKRVKISLGLNHTTRKTPGPLTTAVKATSVLVETSEQPVMPKPKKRLKPILSGRDSHEEKTSRLSSDYTCRENVGDSGEIEEDKDAGTKIQTTAAEVSDDENDQVEVCRPMVDTNSRGGSDIAVQKSIETLPATSDPRETRRFLSLPKTRNKQKLLKGDELKQPSMGNDSKFCTHVTFSVGNKEVATQKVASWPKGAVLERAFHDLEKGVSEAFPHTARDRQVAMEKSTSREKSKRLPRDVKQKLAKVAHLAANRYKIPDDEIIERLTNLIGHIMKPKTLKRTLKSMVKMGLKADQAKDVTLQAKKRETTKLLNSRVVTFLASDAEQLDGFSYDLHENQGSIDKGRFKRDATTENHIGDFYDQHLEGVDEHNIPQITEFFNELADVLPHESMESHEVQNAVCQAKKRRKKQEKVKMGEEKCRKKADIITDKHVETDRETPLMARKFPAPLRPTIVPLLNKGVPQNEKQIMKSSKDGHDDTSKHKGKPNQDTASRKNISLEAARKILVDLGTRHRMEYAKKMRLALPKALQSESTTTFQDQN